MKTTIELVPKEVREFLIDYIDSKYNINCQNIDIREEETVIGTYEKEDK